MPIPPIRPDDERAPTGGIVRAARRPAGWIAPGPRPLQGAPDASLLPRADEDLCWLSGDFRILQKLDGHRWSLDDLMTAWVASKSGTPQRICDLGCGIGTVLLFLAWRFPDATLTGVEAQAESASLARRSIAWNAVGDRVHVRSGDLRDAAILDGETFDLVSGTPPYFPPGTGIESTRQQCAPCRFEHRGGVEDYVRAAARVLAPNGRAVICQGYAQTDRVAPAVDETGLAIEARLDIVPKTGKGALLSIFTLARTATSTTREELVVRERDGQWTSDFRRVREDLGMPPGLTPQCARNPDTTNA